MTNKRKNLSKSSFSYILPKTSSAQVFVSSKSEINILAYDPKWQDTYEKEAHLLRHALGKRLLEIYHIGSTSVPSLAAKPIIDILVVAEDIRDLISGITALEYTYKGEYNLPLRDFYKKKDKSINLHVCSVESGEIDLNLKFRNFLRQNPQARNAYAVLKREAAKKARTSEEKRVVTAYNQHKNSFIKDVLEKAKFDQLCVRICGQDDELAAHKAHYANWQKQGKPLSILERTPASKSSSLYANAIAIPFVLYEGVHKVAVAQVTPKQKEVRIDFISMLTPEKGDLYRSFLLKYLLKWIDTRFE